MTRKEELKVTLEAIRGLIKELDKYNSVWNDELDSLNFYLEELKWKLINEDYNEKGEQ